MGCSQSVNKDVINSIQAAAVPTADVSVSENCKRKTIMLKDIVSNKDSNSFSSFSGEKSFSDKYDNIYSVRMENILAMGEEAANAHDVIYVRSFEVFNLIDTAHEHKCFPYLNIKASAEPSLDHKTHKFYGVANASYLLNYPFAVRANHVSDTITISVMNARKKLFQSPKTLVCVNLQLSRILAAHLSVSEPDIVTAVGTIGTVTVRISFSFQRWSGRYDLSSAFKIRDKTKMPKQDRHIKALLAGSAPVSIDQYIRHCIQRLRLLKSDEFIIPLPSLNTNERKKVKSKPLLDDRFEILSQDVDRPVNFAFKFGNALLSKIFPINHSQYFENRLDSERYTSVLINSVYCVPMCPEGDWGDVTSDFNLTRYCFSNNGQVCIRKTTDGFVCDCSFMTKYEVRDNFVKYGSIVFFDRNGTPTKIELTSLGKRVVKRGEPDWEWAKLHARSSLFVYNSAVHLVGSHYFWGNILSVATNNILSEDNPIRRLLQPHCYLNLNTVIGSQSTLLPDGALVHRATGFSYEGLENMIVDEADRSKFTYFLTELKDQGFDIRPSIIPEEVDHIFPILQDSKDLIGVIRDFVLKYLTYYDKKTPGGIMNSKETTVFWKYLAYNMGEKRSTEEGFSATSFIPENMSYTPCPVSDELDDADISKKSASSDADISKNSASSDVPTSSLPSFYNAKTGSRKENRNFKKYVSTAVRSKNFVREGTLVLTTPSDDQEQTSLETTLQNLKYKFSPMLSKEKSMIPDLLRGFTNKEKQMLDDYELDFENDFPNLDSLETMAHVISELIFRCSAHHFHVGNVTVSGTHSAIVSDHLREGQLLGSLESHSLLSIISYLTAGMISGTGRNQYPGIADDFSYFALDSVGESIMKEYQQNLEKVGKKIKSRNAKRPYEFNSMNPEWVKCSVSS